MSTHPSGASTSSRRVTLGLSIAGITIGIVVLAARVLLAARQGELLVALLAVLAALLIVVLVVVPFRFGVAYRRRALERVPGAALVDVMTPWNTYATLSATRDRVVVYGGYRRLVVRRSIEAADVIAVTAEARPAGARLLQSLVIRTHDGGELPLVLMRWGRLWFGSMKPGPAQLAAAGVASALGIPAR